MTLLLTQGRDEKMFRILFLGQKWLGEKCFDLLRKAPTNTIRICGVVSNIKDNTWWQTNGIYRCCSSEGIPFIPNDKRNDNTIRALITESKINTILSVQHPWIIPHEILSLAEFGAFNLHNAKLPEYRGHNTCNHAILNCEHGYTSTLHRMVGEVDAGTIAFEQTIKIASDDTARALYEKAIYSGLEVFQQLLDCFVTKKEIPGRPIIGEGTFYPRNSLDTLREIRDILNFQEVDSKARAMFFPPFEPAYFRLFGKQHYVLPKTFPTFAKEFENELCAEWGRGIDDLSE
jgi:methionyl-tRNA formyltransferase